MKKVFIDANIIVYYLGGQEPFYEEVKPVFLRIRNSKYKFYTSDVYIL